MGLVLLDRWPEKSPLLTGATVAPIWSRWFTALVEAVNGTMAGTGSPEGIVTARPGTLYRRLDATAGLGLYVKESIATLNTGWRAV